MPVSTQSAGLSPEHEVWTLYSLDQVLLGSFHFYQPGRNVLKTFQTVQRVLSGTPNNPERRTAGVAAFISLAFGILTIYTAPK